MEALLDFNIDFDVNLLDQVIAVFYNPAHPEVRRLGIRPSWRRTVATRFV